MYAVINVQGHQYIVKEGDTIVVDKIDGDIGGKLRFPVLLSFAEDQENVVIGKPFIDGKEVVCDIVEHKQGEKIHITKFRRKNRYARKIGFRAQKTVLSISQLS